MRLSPVRMMWLLAWHYVVNGARRFDAFDPNSGILTPHWLDKNGNFEFQSNQLMSIIDRVVGQLSGLDYLPSVERIGSSRDGLRQRAIGQLLCDATVPQDMINAFKLAALPTFAMLGGIGIHTHVIDHPTMGIISDFEVVHPKQIFPFPSLGQDQTRARGIIRERTVPLSFLYKMYGKKKLAGHFQGEESIEWWEQEHGAIVPDTPWLDGVYGPVTNVMGGGAANLGKPGNGDMQGLARIRELWMYGPANTVTRYCITSGSCTLSDVDLSGTETYCPLQYAKFMDDGSFHGAGIFKLLFSVSRQHELLLKKLVNNITAMDQYGVLVIPHGQFNERAMFKDVGQGLRLFPWEPDPISESFTPFIIQPHDAGDAPGKVAAYLNSFAETMNPIRDLLREKGRVDSASGLQFLDEVASQTMTTATAQLTQAFGNSYRSITQRVASSLLNNPRPIPISRLDLNLAGVVINPEKNEAIFPSNPLPNVSRLRFTIREARPKSEVARKQEALELLREGVYDSVQRLFLYAMKEGIEFAVWMDDYSAAYEAIVRDVLTLYNDGQTPGEVVLTQYVVKADFQLIVLSAFMGSLAMRVSSPEVHDAFAMYRDTLLQWAGMTLPQAIPNPDDTAMLQQPAEQRLLPAGATQ